MKNTNSCPTDPTEEHHRRRALAILSDYVSGHKKERMEAVLNLRTEHITVVLEDIYQPHNAAAVIRTCEAFGIQDLHVIEKEKLFSPAKDIAVGSQKWITLHHHRGSRATEHCLTSLRGKGYSLAALTLDESATPLQQLPLDQPLALCIGSEKPGLTETTQFQCDQKVIIPMFGFAQSFNLSVAVGIALQLLVPQLHRSTIDWRISANRRDSLRLEWYKKSIRNADLILEREMT